MRNEILKFPYLENTEKLINITDVTFSEDNLHRSISFNIKSNKDKAILALKLLVTSFDKDDNKLFEKELSFKNNILKGASLNQEVVLPLESEYGDIKIVSIIDEAINSYSFEGTYTFATYQRVLKELNKDDANEEVISEPKKVETKEIPQKNEKVIQEAKVKNVTKDPNQIKTYDNKVLLIFSIIMVVMGGLEILSNIFIYLIIAVGNISSFLSNFFLGFTLLFIGLSFLLVRRKERKISTTLFIVFVSIGISLSLTIWSMFVFKMLGYMV